MTFTFQYLREHLNIIFMHLIFICLFIIIFYLYHLPLAAVLYPTFLCLLISFLYAIHSIYRAYQKHNKLTVLQSLHVNTIQNALIENPKIEEDDYQQIILRLCQEIQLFENKARNSKKEVLDYFTIWVHQIKTPIASMYLHLENEDSALSRKLKSDLLHIEQYVEMVLTYLKLDSDETDYVFNTVSLDQILKENIRKLRGDFISKKLNLIYIPIHQTIISDEKWLSFVIEQILSNALKYTKQGSVTISLDKSKSLRITDTGIGIASEDLPRIFERGYTGYNGRTDKRASGLGLYLCKQICEQLGHKISVISELEIGTTVQIDLNQPRHINE